MNDKLIGIIGGMGPEATINFYKTIIDKTEVKRDQDHFRVIIDSNPKIPDRTEAILNGGVSPLGEIKKIIDNFNNMKIDMACIPCITSHYYIEKIKLLSNFEVLNAIELTGDFLKKQSINSNIGVLATNATVKTRLFDSYLSDFNIIYPDDNIQEELIMKSIYDIKKGDKSSFISEQFDKAVEHLIEKGAELIILGCTEIVLAIKAKEDRKIFIDPMEILANYIINY